MLKHYTKDVAVQDLVEALRTDGYAIVDELASPDHMDQITHEMAPFIDNSGYGYDNYLGKKTKRTGSLIARSPASHSIIMHPLVLGVTKGLLQKATRFQLQLTQIISVYPDSPAQKLHQDETIWDFFPFPEDYHMQCNVLWAMTDYTAENGATCLVPGSQNQKGRHFQAGDGEAAVMKRGSALFYTGKIFHGAGRNCSQGVRRALNVTYAVGWVRQEENQYLSTPLEIAAKLPDDLLKLMGYQMGCLGMGYVRDFEDPMVVVRPPGHVAPLGIELLAESALGGNAAVASFLGDLQTSEQDGPQAPS